MNATPIILSISCISEAVLVGSFAYLITKARSKQGISTKQEKISLRVILISFILTLVTLCPLLAGDLIQDHNLNTAISKYIADSSSLSVSNEPAYITGKLAIFDNKSEVTVTVMDLYPDSIDKAHTWDDVGTIIVVTCKGEQVGTYDTGLGAYEDSCQLTVIDKTKNTIVGRSSFAGPMPSSSITCRNGVCYNHGGIPKESIREYITFLPKK